MNTLEIVMNSAQGCVASVNRLPSESVAHIFSFLAHEMPLTSKGELEKWDWITVTHVCQYWRIVAAENPSLWTILCIFPRVDVERTKKSLELSKQLDLRIHFTFTTEYSEDCDKAFDHLSLILQQMHRLNRLYLCLDDESGLWTRIDELLAQPAPRLKSLELFVGQDLRDRPEAIPLPSLPHTVTSLEKVTLDYFNLSPYQSFLQGLRILSLDWVEDLTSSDLLRIFGACPQLEEFSLINSYIDVTSWPSIVSLPKLRNLKLDDLDFQTCSVLLSHLSTPITMNWDIECKAFSFSEVLEMGIFPTLLKISLSAEHFVIDAFMSELKIHATGTYKADGSSSEAIIKTKLKIRTEIELDPYQVYIQFTPVIKNSYWGSAKNVHICVLYIWHRAFTEDAWLIFLNSFSSLQHLDFCFSRNCFIKVSLRMLLKALARRYGAAEDKFATCPELEKLSLRYTDSSQIDENFVLMMESCFRVRKMHGSGLHQLLISSLSSVGDERSLAKLSELVDVISWKEQRSSFDTPYYDENLDEYSLQ